VVKKDQRAAGLQGKGAGGGEELVRKNGTSPRVQGRQIGGPGCREGGKGKSFTMKSAKRDVGRSPCTARGGEKVDRGENVPPIRGTPHQAITPSMGQRVGVRGTSARAGYNQGGLGGNDVKGCTPEEQKRGTTSQQKFGPRNQRLKTK